MPVLNNIPEKEQSLVLDFQNIEQGHMVRASKQVSPRGDDYTGYRDMSWYWYNPSHANADLDLFFRVGSDTLNYYEVDYRFAEGPEDRLERGPVNIAELSERQERRDRRGRERPVDGRRRPRRATPTASRWSAGPDLRRSKRYYFGVKNNVLSRRPPVTSISTTSSSRGSSATWGWPSGPACA